MGSETVTLTSIHDLINQLTLSDSDTESHAARSSHTISENSSIIIEGKKQFPEMA